MDTETINKIAETVKTMNLTLDGNLNSDTVQRVVETVAPYYQLYVIQQTFLEIFWGVVLVSIVTVISKTVVRYWKQNND